VYKGALKTRGNEHSSGNHWRDIKTYTHYALIVSEISGHGMQIFDLAELLDDRTNVAYSEKAHYSEFGNAHNIFVNEDSSFAYAVGTYAGSYGLDACSGGLHFVDIRDPEIPVNAGCYKDDGYTHDVQCVIYAGPDSEYVGREICFASNEDSVTIIDVTNKNSPIQIAKFSYNNGYTHQGWLTEDHNFFIFDDELDEINSVAPIKTQTFILNVRKLRYPEFVGIHSGRTHAIDHNLYVKDNLVFQANYQAGLNILQIGDISKGKLEEFAYFDVYAYSDKANFNGAWSNYPFFPSGTVIVSGIEQGLFVLKVTAEYTPRPTAYPTRSLSPTRTNSPTSASFWELTEGDEKDCEITDNESCVTDGDGSYGNNEKCVYTARQDVIIYSDGVFETEIGSEKAYGNVYDYIQIGTRKYYTSYNEGTAFPEKISLKKGETLKWVSDIVTEAEGYKICGRPQTNAPTRSPVQPSFTPAPTFEAFWEVESGGASCEVSDNGRCVTDGEGSYGNNERCVYTVLQDMIVFSEVFQTQRAFSSYFPYDYMQRGADSFFTSYGGRHNFPANMSLNKGDTLKWFSNGMTVAEGYKICIRRQTNNPTTTTIPSISQSSIPSKLPSFASSMGKSSGPSIKQSTVPTFKVQCEGLEKKLCRKKSGECLFSYKKKEEKKSCFPKKEEWVYDCSQHSTPKGCSYARYCFYMEKLGCTHICEKPSRQKSQRKCVKMKVDSLKICKFSKKINPCHKKCCPVQTLMH